MIKKITLYYREMKELLDMTQSELEGKNIIIFKTTEGGFGMRQQCHGWTVGDKVWTADGKKVSTVIAVAPINAIEDLLEIFCNATYMVNRFLDEVSRRLYLDAMEKALLKVAA